MAAAKQIMPWTMPQKMKVCWYPETFIILAIGATVSAVPRPYAPAVNPAHMPR